MFNWEIKQKNLLIVEILKLLKKFNVVNEQRIKNDKEQAAPTAYRWGLHLKNPVLGVNLALIIL